MTTLKFYEEMSDFSGRMLDAARLDDWDEVASIEREVAALRDRIAAAAQPDLSEAERNRKLELIQRILADDAEVRARAEPWMQQLRELIGGASRGRDARRAYDQT